MHLTKGKISNTDFFLMQYKMFIFLLLNFDDDFIWYSSVVFLCMCALLIPKCYLNYGDFLHISLHLLYFFSFGFFIHESYWYEEKFDLA